MDGWIKAIYCFEVCSKIDTLNKKQDSALDKKETAERKATLIIQK